MSAGIVDVEGVMWNEGVNALGINNACITHHARNNSCALSLTRTHGGTQMQDARTRAALLAVCLACLLGSGYILLKGRQTAPPPIVFSNPIPVPASPSTPVTAASATNTSSKRPKPLFVAVAGAVRRPSLYLLPPGSRVMQALLAAGGPAAGADMDAVNLAQPVTDGEKVFVPKRGTTPVPPSPSPVLAAAGKPPAAPAALSAVKAAKGSGSRSGKISADSGEQIGLNTATAEQLQRIPGIGPSMAARIVAYRQQAGGFGKVEDLTLVTGIGPKKYAKIAPFVTL